VSHICQISLYGQYFDISKQDSKDEEWKENINKKINYIKYSFIQHLDF